MREALSGPFTDAEWKFKFNDLPEASLTVPTGSRI